MKGHSEPVIALCIGKGGVLYSSCFGKKICVWNEVSYPL